VVLLRKSIPQRTTYKLPLCLALCCGHPQGLSHIMRFLKPLISRIFGARVNEQNGNASLIKNDPTLEIETQSKEAPSGKIKWIRLIQSTNAPSNSYSIRHPQNESYCACKVEGEWCVFYSEKGNMNELIKCQNEEHSYETLYYILLSSFGKKSQ